MAGRKPPPSRVLAEARRLAREVTEKKAPSEPRPTKAKAAPRAGARAVKKDGGAREKIVTALKKLHPMD